MANDKLQRWALTAEVIGGIAIVISLIFVGYQVRQSTHQAALNRSALETATYQDLNQSISNLNLVLIQDPGLAELVDKWESDEKMNRLEQTRVFLFLINVFRHGDMAFYQYQKGSIDEESLNSVLRITLGRLRIPRSRNAWDRHKKAYRPDYAAYIDALLEKQGREQAKQASE